MPENRETLIAIVEKCLAMDYLAALVYRHLAQNSVRSEVAQFWSEMAVEEERHIEAWKGLLALMFDRETPPLFQDPERVLQELTAQHEQIRAASSEMIALTDLRSQFVAALRLEFYVLHPALERLWQFYGLLSGGARTPAADYERHLRRFAEAVERWGIASPELQLLSSAVLRLWTQLRELSHEASVDALTNVLNRRGLFSNMRLLAFLSRRNEFTAGALMVDIDNFKVINDRLGHSAGDEVLANVAHLISGAVRQSDLVGRYGGEEFLVFLPQVEPGALLQLGEKVRGAVEAGTLQRTPATVSVGAACTRFAEGIEPGLNALIQSADHQLYLAKVAGRNTVLAAPC